ncbi:MAG: RNA polymerase sigma factor [Steroidobacteraceae bacterium]
MSAATDPSRIRRYPLFPVQYPSTTHPCIRERTTALNAEDKQAFIVAVAAQHGKRLRRFLLARVRNAADAADLVQEVFLRLLRIQDHETIRMPEAYVFALANHVLYQHRLRRAQRAEALDILDVLADIQSIPPEDPAMKAETEQRVEQLERALAQLSPRAQAVLVLHRRDGFSLEEIAAHFGVSRPMAKKYLAKALLHCRQQLEEGERRHSQ